MPNKIQFKRGNNNNLSGLSLNIGEPAFTLDTGKLYIGNSSSKTLINPIDKPIGINTSSYYTKVRVNDYGQVTAQSALIASDIPTISDTQVFGLGTLSKLNAGTSSGQVPPLDANGKFPVSTIPSTGVGDFITVYYSSGTSVQVSLNAYVPFNFSYPASSSLTLNPNGMVTINQIGIYLLSYHITASTLQLSTSLSTNSGQYVGSAAMSGSVTNPINCLTSATVVRQVTTVPEQVGVKNMGTTAISVLTGQSSLTILKIS